MGASGPLRLTSSHVELIPYHTILCEPAREHHWSFVPRAATLLRAGSEDRRDAFITGASTESSPQYTTTYLTATRAAGSYTIYVTTQGLKCTRSS
eukprot:6211972-Pleurochrysis_carterae.AAC.1